MFQNRPRDDQPRFRRGCVAIFIVLMLMLLNQSVSAEKKAHPVIGALCVIAAPTPPRIGEYYAKCEDRFRIRSTAVAVSGEGNDWELLIKMQGADAAKLEAFLARHQRRMVALTKKELTLMLVRISGTDSDALRLRFDSEEEVYEMLGRLSGLDFRN